MRHDQTLAHFGLLRPPFDKDIDAGKLWMNPSRTAAVQAMVNAVQRKQHVLVRGEPGVGKSCVARAMRAALPDTEYRVVYVANVTVGRRDFYRQVSLALGLPPKGTMAAVFEAIQTDIRSQWTEHRVHPVLVIDEAHLLPDATLSHLHVLANFDMDHKPLLSLVLVGLPELLDRLRLGVNRSLLTRIHTLVDLHSTTPEDTAAYVRHRLEVAGSARDVFGTDALTALHELAAGVPRLLDTLAERSLDAAADNNLALVGRAEVRRAWNTTPYA